MIEPSPLPHPANAAHPAAATAATNARGRGAAFFAAGVLTALVLLPATSTAHADGNSSPFKGRTEGGSLELTTGGVIACAAAGHEDVVDANGTLTHSGSPGHRFTTSGGAEIETLASGAVEVTLHGATAVVFCPASLIPTTAAFVPRTTLAGAGGTAHGPQPLLVASGAALAGAGLVGGVLLRRNHRRAQSR